LIAAAVAAVLAVILGVGLWVQAGRDTTGDEPAAEPSGVTDDYGIVVGDEHAPTAITVYEDLQCPVCRVFEHTTADRLDRAVAAGEVRVDYRMVSFLDDASTNDYSSRALNAALVVLDTSGVATFKRFHDQLFANQPAEGGPGPEDDQLIEYAVQAGADESAVRGPIEDKVYEQWIKNATDQMSQNDVTGTPTVFIDGEKVEGDSVQDTIDAVLAAAR
jgi:protein-disulfide isomerase